MFKSAPAQIKVATIKCNRPLCLYRNIARPIPGTYNCRGCSRGTFTVSPSDATTAQASVSLPYTYRQTTQDVRRIEEESRRRKEELYMRKQLAAIEVEERKQDLFLSRKAKLSAEKAEAKKVAEEKARHRQEWVANGMPLERRSAVRRKTGSSDGYSSSSSSDSHHSDPSPSRYALPHGASSPSRSISGYGQQYHTLHDYPGVRYRDSPAHDPFALYSSSRAPRY
ncbi:hypothetical protein D9758_012201 [Tetrapyrgos nigripes]|uniref:Uncharacterized protein n=1 Tax=Tetrapyrgos nigripes TaxID=182062 RepID=A0A8H5CGJ4_9AGAR|nr:hypothetical protein D9758_012201 [Tetrapyrgos nigripes]